MDKMKNKIQVWDAGSVRDYFIKEAELYFEEEIAKKDMNKHSKEWHKNIKRYTRYMKQRGLLNMQQGDVASVKEFREAKEGKRKEEDVKILYEEEEISEEQAYWIKDHFDGEEKEITQKQNQKVFIEESEIIEAMEKIGKNKAPSTDETMDFLF